MSTPPAYNHTSLQDKFIEYDEDRKVITPTKSTARIWKAYTAFRDALDS